MSTVFILLLLALAFVYINGFHDTSNSIATVVSTRALTPHQAVVLATLTNLAGALVGTAIATTMAQGLVDARFITLNTIVCALVGAIAWDLATWWWGIPTSSSHALIGGLCGAALAAAQNDFGEIIWAAPGGSHWWEGNGVFYKVIVPMFVSPLLGFVGAFVLTGILYIGLRNWPIGRVDRVFGRLQILSGGYIGFAHGHNDAQKTMGIVVLALMVATKSGTLDNLPSWLGFLRTGEGAAGGTLLVATWLQVGCAVALAAGTAAGGWRIIQTLGRRITELKPVHGFAAETAAATVLTAAAAFGFPVSTTHTITAAVSAVGAARRFRAVHLDVVKKIVWAWIFTPIGSALVAYLALLGLRLWGFK